MDKTYTEIHFVVKMMLLGLNAEEGCAAEVTGDLQAPIYLSFIAEYFSGQQ